jgi:arylsulphatase A
MYFATNDVHVPRFPHERFRGKNLMGVRGDAIVQFDWTVGQLLKKLHELKIDDNTLVILTSDNGPVVDDGYQDRAEELLNGHSPAGPFRGNKYSAFEGGTAVPFIVSWPRKIKGGIVSKALVSQIDLLSSLGSLVHARLPKGSAPDSRNYLPTILGSDQKGRDYVIGQSNTHVLSVLTPQYRYIEPSNGPKMIQWGPKIETGNLPVPQLYDMTVNLYETNNVAAEHPDEVFRMQDILKNERSK